MRDFYDDGLLLHGDAAKQIYATVRDLPIIDYHCHLDQTKIATNASFGDIGELWLAGDHYKWRAMRLCGVDEFYITGKAPYREKFFKYAEILPKFVGNPLYYWTHLELKQIFGINKPLSIDTAEEIFNAANEKLAKLKVKDLLSAYKVEFVATTDDPCDDLLSHGKFGSTTVAPTFRPDKLYTLDDAYIAALGKAAGVKIDSLDDLCNALRLRLDYFASRGCRISDHGFERFPSRYADFKQAAKIFASRASATAEQKEAFFGFLLLWLTREYARRGMIMQIHFAVVRNNNSEAFGSCGADSGFDLISEPQSVKDLIAFFDRTPDNERPQTVLYTLNDSNLPSLAAVTGAFRNLRMGAAWWFNDTVEGIRRNLSVIAEYSALGTNFGMLTDSRSFSSYARFDFFKRILSDYLGKLCDGGEYHLPAAVAIAKDICYNNVKGALKL